MKADHRKELVTTSLTEHFGTALKHAKEGPSQQVLIYGGLAVLVVAVGLAFYWFSTRSKEADAVRWEQYSALSRGDTEPATPEQITALYVDNLGVSKEALERSPDKEAYAEYTSNNRAWLDRLVQIDKFEKANPGTEQARLARFTKARHLLDKSSDFKSFLAGRREMAAKWTRKAAEVYDKLFEEAGGEPRLAQEALYNGGKAYEMLGDFDKARLKYERLNKDYPTGLYKADADKALARLKDTKDLDMLKMLTATR